MGEFSMQAPKPTMRSTQSSRSVIFSVASSYGRSKLLRRAKRAGKGNGFHVGKYKFGAACMCVFTAAPTASNKATALRNARSCDYHLRWRPQPSRQHFPHILPSCLLIWFLQRLTFLDFFYKHSGGIGNAGTAVRYSPAPLRIAMLALGRQRTFYGRYGTFFWTWLHVETCSRISTLPA